jgi:hypothetical protein
VAVLLLAHARSPRRTLGVHVAAGIFSAARRKWPRQPSPNAAELVNELLALGNEWAAAHPEEFEKAACEEFDDHIFYIVHDTFDELTRICSDAQGHFRRILNDEPEFRNYASTPLRRRVQKRRNGCG